MIQKRSDLTVIKIVSLMALVYLVYLIFQGILSFFNNAWPVYIYLIYANEIMELAAVAALTYAVFSHKKKSNLLLPCILITIAFLFATLSSVVILFKSTWFPDLWRQLIFRAAGFFVFVFISADSRAGLKRIKADFILLAIYWLLILFGKIIAMMNSISSLNLQTALFTYIFPSFLSASFILLLIFLHRIRNKKHDSSDQSDQIASDKSVSLEEQLEALDTLYAQGGITYKEYTDKRKELIRQS